jgi:predicted phosphodiesterase
MAHVFAWLMWSPIVTLAVAHVWGGFLLLQDNGARLLANTPDNVRRIDVAEAESPSRGAVWKFAVIGDLGKRYEIFLRALSEMQRNDIRFVVITGDLVYRKTAEQYEYLKLKIAQSGFDRPIFAAVGNEDVAVNADYSLFRRHLAGSIGTGQEAGPGIFPYGEGYTERFAFIVPGSMPSQAMFILWDNAFGTASKEQIAWIDRLMDQYRKSVRHVFLVSHQPIVGFSQVIQTVPSTEYLAPGERSEEPGSGSAGRQPSYELVRVDPASRDVPSLQWPAALEAKSESEPWPRPFRRHYRPLYELVKKYRITAVFSGHLHGYRRYQIGDTLHFVTGGGGARLQYPESLHHYLEVEVRDTGVTARPRILNNSVSALTKIEQVLIAEIFLYFRNRAWLYGVAAVWIVAVPWLLRAGKRRGSWAA